MRGSKGRSSKRVSNVLDDPKVTAAQREEIEALGRVGRFSTWQVLDGHNRRSMRKLDDILDEDMDSEEEVTLWLRFVAVMVGEPMERLVGLLIMVNFMVIVWETDIRSTIKMARSDSAEFEAAEARLQVLDFINNSFLVIYMLECAVRILILRFKFFVSTWNLLDLSLVAFGSMNFVLEFVLGSQHAAMLRALRMIRLLRLSRIFIGFKELRSLIWGLTHCMKTLFWATGLIFLTLTVWSIVAVEYVRPLMNGIDYGSCVWCEHAFQDVLTSNLTFFQIISGDGWSTLARPIIDLHAWTAFIFVSVILVVVFGLLNLIIAAIVDTAAQAREADVECQAEVASEAREEAWNTFRDLCIQLDTDNNGGIGLDELRNGLKKNQKLRDYFSMMEINEDDMIELFNLLDVDNSGDLSYREFHNQLYKMKTLAVKTQLYYVTRYVQWIQKQLEQHGSLLQQAMGGKSGTDQSDAGGAFSGASGAQSVVCTESESAPGARLQRDHGVTSSFASGHSWASRASRASLETETADLGVVPVDDAASSTNYLLEASFVADVDACQAAFESQVSHGSCVSHGKLSSQNQSANASGVTSVCLETAAERQSPLEFECKGGYTPTLPTLSVDAKPAQHPGAGAPVDKLLMAIDSQPRHAHDAPRDSQPGLANGAAEISVAV